MTNAAAGRRLPFTADGHRQNIATVSPPSPAHVFAGHRRFFLTMTSPTPHSPTQPSFGLINKVALWKASPANGNYYINSVAVSAAGDRVIGGTFYKIYKPSESRRSPHVGDPTPSESGVFGAYCYDGTGRPLWSDEFKGWQGVYWVAMSSDGSRAAAGGLMQDAAPMGFVRAYDAQTGLRLLHHPTKDRVNQVSLSGNGAWLISAAESLLLFRGPTQPGTGFTLAAEFKSPDGAGFVSASLSADGRTIAYADYGGGIGVLTNDNGSLQSAARWSLPGQGVGDFCHMISLAPDGSCFAAGGYEGKFYFFNTAQFIATQQPTLAHQTSAKGPVYGVAVAPDGSRFAGVVNSGDIGQAHLLRVAPTGAQVEQTDSLLANPNCASLILRGNELLYAIAVGHSETKSGYYYFFRGPADEPGLIARLQWVFPTGKMSWPIVISAQGNAIVGGSDDSHLYYFTP